MFKPTEEQIKIFATIKKRPEDVLIEAYAGTGKTTTIVNAIRLLPKDKRILFLAFNKHIQEELKEKLPDYVNVYTTYGIGNSALLRKYKKIKFDQFRVDNYLMSVVDKWKISSEFEYEDDLMKYLNNLKQLVNLSRLSLALKEEHIASLITKYDINLNTDADVKRAFKVLSFLSVDRKTYDFTDMIFLPVIDKSIWFYPYDYVFIDEVQDLNRCQINIVEKNLKKPGKKSLTKGRLISVGDKNQCQPKGTKILMYDGTEKDISDIVVGDKVTTYDRKNKGRFVGYYKNHRWGAESMIKQAYNVNNVSSRHYSDELIVIEGLNKKSKYTKNHKCMVRIDKDSAHKYMVYLMEREGYFRIGISPIWSKSGIDFAANRAKQEKAEKLWILKTYVDRISAYSDEQYYSTIFSIPQVIFNHNQQKGNINQSYINSYYNRFNKDDLRNNVLKLLNEFKREYDYPFWVKNVGCYFSKLHMFELTACNIIPDIMEIILFDENNTTQIKDKKYKQIIILPTYTKITNLTYEKFDDIVYSLEIDKHEVYVADGILTHNSIYGFNGSSEKGFEWFRERESTKVLPLSYSFRCSKNIIAEANKIVPQIKSLPTALEGDVREGKVLEEAKAGDFVLCRTTVPLIVMFYLLLDKKQKAKIKGSDVGSGLVEMTKSHKNIDELIKYWNKKLDNLKMALLSKNILDYTQDSSYISMEDSVNTLTFMAKKNSSIDELVKNIEDIFSDDIGGNWITLSTIHKVKGLEADRVFIIRPDKLPLPVRKKWQIDQEMNLKYVAITRAKNELIYDTDFNEENY